MEGQGMFIVTQFCCPVDSCSKEYRTKFCLKKHINLSHLGISAFNCPVCNKMLVSKQNLREHLFTHSGQKPFKCSFCGKRFRQTSQLCMHKRTHKKRYAETLKYVLKLDNE